MSYPDGRTLEWTLLGNKNATPLSVLALNIRPIPPLNDGLSVLSFIGGFDSESVVNDLARPSTFLALMCPIVSAATLRDRIGTVDYMPMPTNES